MNPKAIQYSPSPVGLGKKRKLIKTEVISEASLPNEESSVQLPPERSPSPAESSNDELIKRLLDIEQKCEYLRT